LAVVAQSPSLVGLGLDEDTAAVIKADQTLEVIGKGAVTIVDGSQVLTDAFNTKGYRPMMVSGAILHSLPAGQRFDLTSRTLLTPPQHVPEKPARVRTRAPSEMRKLAREIAIEGVDSLALERQRRRAATQREASE
jgi:cyanophycinase